MKIIKVNTRLTNNERETVLIYDYINKVWRMDSTIDGHYNKALCQEWTPIIKYIYKDGTTCGMVLEAPVKSITIRNPNKKRVFSEEQIESFRKRMIERNKK